VRAVAVSPEGQYVVAGRMNGGLVLYYLTGTVITPTNYLQTAYVYKDGVPYAGAEVTVSESSTYPYTWAVKNVVAVDNAGKITFYASEGYSYKFDIGTEYSGIFTTTAAHAPMVIQITTPPVSYSYKVSVSEGVTPGTIIFNFTSNKGAADSIVATVVNAGTGSVIVTETYLSTATVNDVIITGMPGINLRVDTTINFPGEYPIRQSQMVLNMTSGFPQISIPGLDVHQKNALFIILLMIIAGLFSYANAHRGAIIVVFFAAAMNLLGLITVPLYIIAFAGVLAILAAFVRGSRT
jgi:hypothetical protein